MLLALVFGAPALGQRIFQNGFEAPCDLADVDGDRLTGCQETAAQTNPVLRDTDGDGLSDGDEVLGTPGGLNLPALGVNPRHKDILLEYDWFDDSNEVGSNALCPANAVHSHRPTQAMADIVTVMFGAAPVDNPDGLPGIKVIHDFGQGGLFTGGNVVADADGIVDGNVFDAEYVATYNLNFAPNRRGYFHYVLMPHRYKSANGNTGSTGYAEIDGGLYTDAIMVSMRCIASTTWTANTIAHELGHNLKLNHGGAKNDVCNNKPNYNSIMNYRFQLDGVDNDCQPGHVPGSPPDFSTGKRLTLNEAALSEAAGMCAGIPTDWNSNGSTDQVLVNWDLNDYPDQLAECGGVYTPLSDHDDWAAVVLPIASEGGAGGGGSNESLVGVECAGPASAKE